MAASLETVIEQVKALSPDDQRRLHRLLQEKLAAAGPAKSEDDFERELLAQGLLTRIPPPITDLTPYQNRRTVRVEGQPLSEQIIEERR
jgi:hypothetical protein